MIDWDKIPADSDPLSRDEYAVTYREAARKTIQEDERNGKFIRSDERVRRIFRAI